LSKVLAALLVFAALLKIDGLVSGTTHVDAWLSTPSTLLAVVALEVLVAMWLAFSAEQNLAWMAAAGFFLCALVAALWIAWEGVAYCPCFGRLHVSPWVAVLIDLSALISLGFIRPQDQSIGALFASLARQPWGCARLLVCALPAVALAAPASWLDSDYLAQWRGEHVRISPRVASAGAGERGRWGTVTVTVKNGSPGPITLLNGTADCSCVAIDALPQTLASGEVQSIPVRIRFVGTPGRFARRYFFYTDSPDAPYLPGIIAGHVSGSGEVTAAAQRES
jgi:hypothetical protein